MKKLLSSLLIVIMILNIMPFTDSPFVFTSNAATIIASGDCGDHGSNVQWSLDSDGVLTISGTGKMKEYIGEKTPPWTQNNLSIKKIVFNGVSNISSGSFDCCYNLVDLVFSESVNEIESMAFCGCHGLKNITIPKDIRSVSSLSFFDYYGIESITVEKANKYYYSEGNCIIDRNKGSIIKGCSNSIIPTDNNISIIGTDAFRTCQMTEITIPDNISVIENGAFIHCQQLSKIIIPDSVNVIGDSAFENCSNLQSIKLPMGIKRIEGNYYTGTFRDCINLKSIQIPEGVEEIQASAFSNCSSLNEIYLPKSIKTIDVWAFKGCSSLKDVFYTGQKKQWDTIEIDKTNTNLCNATLHFTDIFNNKTISEDEARKLATQYWINLYGDIGDYSFFVDTYQKDFFDGYKVSVRRKIEGHWTTDDEILVSSDGQTVKSIYTKAPIFFNEKSYIADLWLKQKKGLDSYPEYDDIRMLLEANCLSEDISSSLAKNSPYQASFYIWDGLNTIFNPTKPTKVSLDRTQTYEALIFALLENVFAEEGKIIHNEILTLIDQTNTLTSGLKEYKSYIDDIDKIAFTPDKSYDILKKAGIKKGSDLYNKLSESDTKSKWGDNNFLKGVNTLIEGEQTIAKFYDRFKGYVLAYNMGLEIKSYLEEMQKNTPNEDLKKALDDVIQACQNADYAAFVLKRDLVADQGLKIGKELLTTLLEKCAVYKALKDVYEAETAIINLFMNTGGIIDSFTSTVATSSFVNAAKATVYSTSTEYLNNKTEDNAAKYVYAVRTYRYAYLADLECALKFVKAATEESLFARSAKLGGKIAAYITGSDYETTYEHMTSRVNLIKNNLIFKFDELNNSWIYRTDCLRADYPELFNLYTGAALSSDHFQPIISDAYVNPDGDTILKYTQPLLYKHKTTQETHYLYGSAYIDGLEMTEQYGSFRSEYEFDNPATQTITTSPYEKNVFPRNYTMVGFINDNGNRIYTSPTELEIGNPSVPPYISCFLRNDNTFEIRIYDKTALTYKMKYHIYRSLEGEKEKEITVINRNTVSLYSLYTPFVDLSAASGKNYSYRVVSEMIFNDGTSMLSPPSNTIALKDGKLDRIDDVWVRETLQMNKNIRNQSITNANEQYSLTVGWKSVGNSHRYQVFRKADFSDEYVQIATDLTSCEFCDTNVVKGHSYSYTVFGYTQSNNVSTFDTSGSAEFTAQNSEVMVGDINGDKKSTQQTE